MGISLIAFVVVLGVLIFAHELGHFLVARLFGVGVEKFSLGFGPRLLGKTVGRTDYRISAIPLGGYVKMVGEDPDGDIPPEDIACSFTHKNVYQRIAIVAAGPLFNLLLAVIVFFVSFWLIGIEDIKPVIRSVDADGPAYHAGLRTGDVVARIDGQPIESWSDIHRLVDGAGGRAIDIDIARNGEMRRLSLTPVLKTGADLLGDPVTYHSAGFSGLPVLQAVVGGVSKDSPAANAGLKVGDKIVGIDGQAVDSWNDMREIIADSGGKAMSLTIRRMDDTLSVQLTPELRRIKNRLGNTEERYLIGISTANISVPESDRVIKRLSLAPAFMESLQRTYFVVEVSFRGIYKMINGSISSDNLGGPILIAQMAGQQAEEGIDKLIQFIGFISINLAILNILPIPVLDGGHLLFFLVEAVRGRPVSIRVREIAQQAGMFVLLMLMVFVFYNDITRLLFN